MAYRFIYYGAKSFPEKLMVGVFAQTVDTKEEILPALVEAKEDHDKINYIIKTKKFRFIKLEEIKYAS